MSLLEERIKRANKKAMLRKPSIEKINTIFIAENSSPHNSVESSPAKIKESIQEENDREIFEDEDDDDIPQVA